MNGAFFTMNRLINVRRRGLLDEVQPWRIARVVSERVCVRIWFRVDLSVLLVYLRVLRLPRRRRALGNCTAVWYRSYASHMIHSSLLLAIKRGLPSRHIHLWQILTLVAFVFLEVRRNALIPILAENLQHYLPVFYVLWQPHLALQSVRRLLHTYNKLELEAIVTKHS